MKYRVKKNIGRIIFSVNSGILTLDEILAYFEPIPESQEIEPLGKADFANTPDEKEWYRDLFVINSKINELVKVVNQLRKES